MKLWKTITEKNATFLDLRRHLENSTSTMHRNPRVGTLLSVSDKGESLFWAMLYWHGSDHNKEISDFIMCFTIFRKRSAFEMQFHLIVDSIVLKTCVKDHGDSFSR